MNNTIRSLWAILVVMATLPFASMALANTGLVITNQSNGPLRLEVSQALDGNMWCSTTGKVHAGTAHTFTASKINCNFTTSGGYTTVVVKMTSMYNTGAWARFVFRKNSVTLLGKSDSFHYAAKPGLLMTVQKTS